ncbi:MAG: DUF4492 domain-containing protein [Candidatus Cryptobacteroides sp.]
MRKPFSKKIAAIADLYIDGFRNMTWGRQLWWLILLKIAILFLVLRLFFFKPVLAGKSDGQKSEFVGQQLIKEAGNLTDENTKTQ